MEFKEIDLPATITAFGTLFASAAIVLNIWLGYLGRKQVKQSADKAAKVSEENHVQLTAIHRLVNGPHKVALTKLAELSKELADNTHQPEHIAYAFEAERLLKEHIKSEENALAMTMAQAKARNFKAEGI